MRVSLVRFRPWPPHSNPNLQAPTPKHVQRRISQPANSQRPTRTSNSQSPIRPSPIVFAPPCGSSPVQSQQGVRPFGNQVSGIGGAWELEAGGYGYRGCVVSTCRAVWNRNSSIWRLERKRSAICTPGNWPSSCLCCGNELCCPTLRAPPAPRQRLTATRSVTQRAAH